MSTGRRVGATRTLFAGARRRIKGGSRGSATLGLALVVAAVTGGMALGNGVSKHTVASSYDLTWLPDSTHGQVVQVDPDAGKANLRLQVAGAGDALQVQQGNGKLIIADQKTGKVTTIDMSTLLVGGARNGAPGAGVKVLLDGAQMYIANLATGSVQAVDPATEASIGTAWSAGRALVDIAVDGHHKLWALDSDNHLVDLTWSAKDKTLSPVSSSTLIGSGRGSVIVSHPSGVTVIGTQGSIAQVGTGDDHRLSAPTFSGPLSASRTSPSDLVPVSSPGTSSVVIVSHSGAHVDDVATMGCTRPGAPVVFGDRIYVPCLGAGLVLVLDRAGQAVGNPVRTPDGGDAQLVPGSDRLLISVPGASYATVIGPSGDTSRIQIVDPSIGVQKPTQPPPPITPPKITPPHGKKSDKGGDLNFPFGGGHAGKTQPPKGNKGKGADRPSDPPVASLPPVAPPSTGRAPAATGSAEASAQPDGTVLVTWTSKHDDGASYVITVVGGDGTPVAQAPAGSTSATITVLSPGTTAAFQVAAYAPGKTGDSKSADPLWTANTDSVLSFTRPGAVSGVQIGTPVVAGGRAALPVSWTAAPENGRSVTYSITAPGATTATATGTSTSISVPCAAGCSGTVTVSPTSSAGDGTAATATYNSAAPLVAPRAGEAFVSVANEADGYNDGGVIEPATVSLTLSAPSDWAAYPGATCGISDNGLAATAVPCNASGLAKSYTYRVRGSVTHTYKVTITWPGGTADSAPASSLVFVPAPPPSNPPCLNSLAPHQLAGMSQPTLRLPNCPLPNSVGGQPLVTGADDSATAAEVQAHEQALEIESQWEQYLLHTPAFRRAQ